MSVSAETDHGLSTELDQGVVVGRAPLMRLGRSIYLFLVTLDRRDSAPLTAPGDRPGGPHAFAIRWDVSLAAEVDGRWVDLDRTSGGGGAGYGPDGAEFIDQQCYALPDGAEPERLRVRYRLKGFDPVEEVLPPS
ncbi:MAG TPA: hypothetical protein VHC49_00525 [Mycobacteriales bacterium]|nr:hypothetical protein [Mycobacteriales bacterium]